MANSQPPGPPTGPPTGNGPVMFSLADAKRTNQVVNYTERVIRGGGVSPRNWGGQGVNPGTLATTNGAIAAGTATVPTSGLVTLRAFDGTTLSADTGNTVTAFNYHDKTIASGSLVFLAWALGVWWVIDVRSCNNIS